MSLVDDVVKFTKDLVLGDFEEQPGKHTRRETV